MEDALARSITALHLLGATAKDYDAQTAAKGVLEKRVNKDVIGSLHEVDVLAQELDVQVPVELLAYVDGNKSPAQYTLDTLARTVAHNESTLGKMAAMKTLWAQLDAELAGTFPEDRAPAPTAPLAVDTTVVKSEAMQED